MLAKCLQSIKNLRAKLAKCLQALKDADNALKAFESTLKDFGELARGLQRSSKRGTHLRTLPLWQGLPAGPRGCARRNRPETSTSKLRLAGQNSAKVRIVLRKYKGCFSYTSEDADELTSRDIDSAGVTKTKKKKDSATSSHA